MIVRGSINFTPCGRKKKKFVPNKRQKSEFKPLTRAVVPNQRFMEWEEQQKKYKSAEFVPTSWTPNKDKSFKKEISKKYTISIPYNKGAYQVIPASDIDKIGR